MISVMHKSCSDIVYMLQFRTNWLDVIGSIRSPIFTVKVIGCIKSNSLNLVH